MKAKELLQPGGDLNHKARTVTDLIRHINTKEEKSTANYSIFLGAGASVTSGISAAKTLIDEWAIELYERFNHELPQSPENALSYFEKNHPAWFNSAHPYSSLFEKKFDLPTQRRRFVEQEVDKKSPSLGYAYLTSLVDNNFFNTIFTTNFDDLVNEAFYLFSNERPIICAHDSSVHSISITSKRPKIIKLHGDYLFDDIKSTLRETESLEHNTKEKFVEFCKEFGLIIVGYSGSDRSIVDVLEFLIKQENYLKNGIYWCLRPEDDICHALRNLLWKDKVYPVLIDGFDEFFAETHNKLVGKSLNLSTSTKQSKLQNTIKKITEDKYKISNNKIIRQEIETILETNSSQDISEFITSLSKDSAPEAKLGILDLRNLLEVRSLIERNSLRQAYETCEDYFHDCTTIEAKSRYIEALINISEKLHEDSKADRWCEKLIEIDPNNIQYQTKRSKYIYNPVERFKFLEKLLPKFEFSVALHNQLGATARRAARMNNQEITKLTAGIEFLEKSLTIDPSLDNSAWTELYESLELKSKISSEFQSKPITEDLIKKARLQNPEHTQTLELSQLLAEKNKDPKEIKGLIDLLYGIHKKSSSQKKSRINTIISKTLNSIYDLDHSAEMHSELSNFFENHIADQKIEDPDILVEKSRYLLAIKKNTPAAAEVLGQAIRRPHIANLVTSAMSIGKLTGTALIQDFEICIEKERHNLYPEYYLEALSEIHLWKGDLDAAKEYLNKAFRAGLPLNTYLCGMSFLHLKSESYMEVISLYENHKPIGSPEKHEAFYINLHYAAKKLGNALYSDTFIRNLGAKSNSNCVKICAFTILDNNSDAKRLIKHQIENSYINFLNYKSWPVINQEHIQALLQEDSDSTAA